jgi:ABC-type dipeptide/oligopeptide/nickel transport system ATPase component
MARPWAWRCSDRTLDPPSGCRFHTRCPHAMPICREIESRLAAAASGRRVARYLVESSRE